MEVTTHKARIVPLPCVSRKDKNILCVEVHSNCIHLKNRIIIQRHCYRGKVYLYLPYKKLNYQCYDRFSPCNVINRFLTVPFLQDFTIEIMTSSIRGTSNFLYSFESSQKTTRYIFSIIMS